MKRVAPVVAIIALLASIAVTSPLTTASAQGGQTLRYSARFSEAQIHEVDVDDSGGESPGDYLVGNFVLRSGGKTRGHLEFHCDIVTASPDRNLCYGVVHINRRGEFTVTDVSPSNSEKEKVTITGGIGTFSGASGNGKFTFGRNRVKFVFKVK